MRNDELYTTYLPAFATLAAFYQLIKDNNIHRRKHKKDKKDVKIEELQSTIKLLEKELDSCPSRLQHHKNKDLWRH